jgi:hypothetical protein
MVWITTTIAITTNYIQEAHKALDLHKPADFTHTGWNKQEKAVNSLRTAYSGNFV